MPRKVVPEDLFSLRFVSSVVPGFEPGSVICCVKEARSAGKYRTTLWQCQPDADPVALTQGDVADTGPAFCPATKTLAFISDRAKPGAQIFLLTGKGSEPEPLTSLAEGAMGSLKWSPDGRFLAFTYAPTDLDRTEAASTARKESEASDPPQVIERWPYRLDGEGLYNNAQVGLWVYDLQSGDCRMVVPDNASREYDFAWFPDSRRLLVARDDRVEAYLEPSNNELSIVDMVDGTVTEISTPKGTCESLSIDPTGSRAVAIFNDRERLPYGPLEDRFLVIELVNCSSAMVGPRNLFLASHVIGDARDPASTQLFWTRHGLVAHYGSHGQQHVVLIDPETFELEDITPDFAGEIHVSFVREDGSWAGYATGVDTLAEVCTGDVAERKWTFISDFNATFHAETSRSRPEPFAIQAEDGYPVEGWVLRPPEGVEPNGRAAVEVHGGPMAMYTNAFFLEMQCLAAAGFTVYFSNPRGSTGVDEHHVRCIMGAWGDLDWKDVQAVTRLAQANHEWVGILGGSYGGFMVNWAVSHSQEYARAITDRCVSNLLSKWGNSDYLFVPDGAWPGTAFRDYSTLWECSPIKHFANVTTPTMIIHSEGDLRCNIEQGEQVYAALKILGVETRFVRYPASTSHGMSRGGPPDLRVHRLNMILEWMSM